MHLKAGALNTTLICPKISLTTWNKKPKQIPVTILAPAVTLRNEPKMKITQASSLHLQKGAEKSYANRLIQNGENPVPVCFKNEIYSYKPGK